MWNTNVSMPSGLLLHNSHHVVDGEAKGPEGCFALAFSFSTLPSCGVSTGQSLMVHVVVG